MIDRRMNGAILEPLPYHIELRNYLKTRERELWDWFASARAQADYAENLRLELLKATYRLNVEDHADLYRSVDEVKARLQLDLPVTLYQAQHTPQTNATLYFMPNEGHIVFSGSVLTLLNREELKALLGHELAHYHLWRRDGGDFHVTDRLVEAVACDARASLSHVYSARRYHLYTEIFADHGALCVTQDPHPVIAGLVKVQTGLSQVNAASYLKQAEEIFTKSNVITEQLSHPETFIRARALTLWQESHTDVISQISTMIEGKSALGELDLLGQVRLTALTRKLLEQFLRPKWFQTPAVLGHARLFLGDFQPQTQKVVLTPDELKLWDPQVQEYLGYVLLDFISADPELEELPLAAGVELCQQLGIDTLFEKLVIKELKLKPRDLKRIKEQAVEMLAKAEDHHD